MAALIGLAAAGLLLVALSVRTARPVAGCPDFDGYLARWSTLHGGYDPRPSRVVRGWLHGVYLAARPLTRLGLPPDLVTGWGLALAYGGYAVAALGGRWPVLAALLVGASGFLDNLDGAVAALCGRASRFGYVLDSLADRGADAAYLLALWRLGASAPVTVGAAAALVLLEYTRARAGNAGMGEIGVVTVGERPIRTIVTGLALLSAGLVPGTAPDAALAGATATLAVSVVGLVQLLVVVRRALGVADGPDHSGRTDQAGGDSGGLGDQGQPAPGMRGPADQVEPRHR